MRLKLSTKVLCAAAGAAGLLIASPGVALAQQSIDPTETPTRFDGGWVYLMALLMGALGVLIVVWAIAMFMRHAPRFTREEDTTVRAERIVPGKEVRRMVEVTPATAVPVPAPVGAPAAAPASPAATPRPASAPPAPAAAAPAPTPAPATPTPAAAPSASPAAPPAAPAPAEHKGPAELDQETFDRVLAEQLEKGVDRRVAEGRARSAAVVAARKKAGG